MFGCARSVPGWAKFIFLKDCDGHTRVIGFHGYDLIRDVVGMMDGTFMLHSMVTFLISLVLFRVKVSLIMTPFGYLVDSVVGRITLTFLDSGSVEIVLQRVVGRCVVTATGVEHPGLILLLLLLLGILVGVEAVAKALWVGTLLLVLATCRPRLGNRVSCLLVDHQVLGLEPHPKMLIPLRYLENCVEHSSFFRRSCLQRTSPSMRSWWLLLLKKKGPRNVSSCFGKKCNLKTARESKKLVMLNRLLSLERMQQSDGPCFKVYGNSLRLLMMESVLCRLWLRIRQCPLVLFLNHHHSLRHVLLLRLRKICLILLSLLIKKWKIVKMMKNWSWPPVRRFSHVGRRNKIGVVKGFTKQRHEKRLPASKHVILEDDELTENTGKHQSGKEIADMLCNMLHEKLLEVVQNFPASMLQQFVPNVSAAIAPTVVSIPASSSG